MERLGRLRVRSPTIAPFYEIKVAQPDGQASRLTWEIAPPEQLQNRFAGVYHVCSHRQDLDDAELWSLYMMLSQGEDAFRTLTSELGRRPVYHHLDRRLVGHLFITVLAYQLLATIQSRLRGKGLSCCWHTIRSRLATQMRATVAMNNDQGERLTIRQTTDPEPFHRVIYPRTCHPNL